MLGPTRGVYLEGYGAVFTAEVNLVAGPQIGILTPSMTKQDYAQHRQKKLARIPELKKAMAKALADTAASPEMAAVPPDEQIGGVPLAFPLGGSHRGARANHDARVQKEIDGRAA
jgi:hypothetical protein